MAISSPRELFVHELSDVMSAEQQILKVLPELQQEAQHAELKRALKEHETETKGQIKNLQAVFKQLGEKPEETTCYGMQGLVKEHQALHDEEPSPDMLERANLSAAAKTEQYEVVAYTGLIQLAKELGENESADLLQENLDQEKAMAKRVADLAKAIAKEAKPA
jgi:ferritin-like metal-binding protein YciE